MAAVTAHVVWARQGLGLEMVVLLRAEVFVRSPAWATARCSRRPEWGSTAMEGITQGFCQGYAKVAWPSPQRLGVRAGCTKLADARCCPVRRATHAAQGDAGLEKGLGVSAVRRPRRDAAVEGEDVVWGCVSRSTRCATREVIVPLYSSLVKGCLVFCEALGCLQKDMVDVQESPGLGRQIV